MRIRAKFDDSVFPSKLTLTIFDAPHRRMHVRTIQQYREHLVRACRIAGAMTPIEDPIDLDVTFINPSSPDLGNIYLALEQAMDHTTLKRPGVVLDDGLISKVTMMKLFINQRK